MKPNLLTDLPRAKIKPQRRFSLVWLVPCIAAVAAGWLIFESLRQLGPLITITFVDGNGLQANQTVLKYHGVRVGEVVSVKLSKDLQQVVAQVRLQRSAAGLASEGSQFWIVRPEVSSAGLHGLETIVSGPYIQAQPGTGKAQKYFAGLEEGPVEQGDDNHKFEVILTTPQINTLSVGSSVYYRGFEVGTVSYFALDDDARIINIHLLIETNFAPLICTGTKFWNAGGISVRLKLLGINVSAENFKSLLIGGIAFATPTDPGPSATNGATFPLYDKPDNSWLDWSPSISITNANARAKGDTSPSMLLNDVSPTDK